MDLPPYMLSRPPMTSDDGARLAFDNLFDQAVAAGNPEPIAYDLPWPRWQFICHIADTRPVVLHGSQNGTIGLFEPRKATDAHPFGDRKAVFGAADGLWPIFYAILDRATHPMMIINSAARLEAEDGTLGEPFYFFSVSRLALQARPFRAGTVYFIPADGFEAMPPETVGGRRLHVAQRASLSATAPVAHIAVDPSDFPFLHSIRGHDDATVWSRAQADPTGFPWLDESEMARSG